MKAVQLADVFYKSKTAGTQMGRRERSFKRARMESHADDINKDDRNRVKAIFFIQDDAQLTQCLQWPSSDLSLHSFAVLFFFLINIRSRKEKRWVNSSSEIINKKKKKVFLKGLFCRIQAELLAEMKYELTFGTSRPGIKFEIFSKIFFSLNICYVICVLL